MNKRSTIRPDSKMTPSFTPVPRGVLQRKCACGKQSTAGEECSECQKNHQTLQRKPHELEQSSDRSQMVPPIVDEVLNSPGEPLDEATRGFMEPRFGHDFSSVRVHTDSRASESARAVNAEAYTVGRDVAFAPGKYAPTTETGSSLLAHELSHVVQQEGSSGATSQAISHPSDRSELEADVAAREVLSGEQVEVNQSPSASMQLALDTGQAVGVGLGVAAGAGLIGLGIAALAGAFDRSIFTDADLEAYLNVLAKTRRIEDHRDSDNKARDIVRRWSNGDKAYDINAGHRSSEGVLSAFDLKVLLTREMLSGVVGDDDEQAILKIFEAAGVTERTKLADIIGYDKLYDKFDGSELDELYTLLPQLGSFHPRGKELSKAYTFHEYIDKWEKEQGTVITLEEKRTLAAGCIGVTALNLFTLGNPDLSNCYDTFAQVWEASRKMNDFLAAHFPDRKALIFSKRFWSGDKEFAPDPKTGKVDMSEPTYARPGFTNFDYGLYDEKTGNWWHANHCDTPFLAEPECHGPMEVYESNLQHYSRTLGDFDRQVFCVAVAIKPHH